MKSKDALEHVCNICDHECCAYIHYDKSRCVFYGLIRQDLDRLEKLEKENQELKERYRHRAETSNDLCKAVKQQLEHVNSWDIEELPFSKFEEKYPKWFETINNKYDNLPRKRFIIIYEDNSFTAIDNRTGDFWYKDFNSMISTIKYLFK